MDITEFQYVGMIGLGTMGYPMVQNLVKRLPSTTKIIVYDVLVPLVEKIRAEFPEKVEKGEDVTDVFSRSNAVITMLPEGKHVRSVFMGSETQLETIDLSGKIFLDCSTIDVESSNAVKDYLASVAPAAAFYATPVSGGVRGASAGTLAFYVSTREDDMNFRTIRELLSCMGDDQKIIACGNAGSGLVAKICNNYLSGVMNIAACEAMNLGVCAGLDPHVLHRVICAGAARNGIIENSQPVPGVLPTAPSSRDYAPNFRASLMAKDVSLAVRLAETSKAKLVLGPATFSTYQEALAELGHLDFTVLFKLISRG